MRISVITLCCPIVLFTVGACTEAQKELDKVTNVITAPLQLAADGLDNLSCATGRGKMISTNDFKKVKGCAERERQQAAAQEEARRKSNDEVAGVFGAIASLYLAAMIDSSTRMMTTDQTEVEKIAAVRENKTGIITQINQQLEFLNTLERNTAFMIDLTRDEGTPPANAPTCVKDIYDKNAILHGQFGELQNGISTHARSLTKYQTELQNTSDTRTASVLTTAAKIYQVGATDRVDNPSAVFSTMRTSQNNDTRTAALFDDMQASDRKLESLVARYQGLHERATNLSALCKNDRL